eukprot:TRINITY_DN22332_c0_g1_i1.p1 TRINITY_DN22332_c0_g1~~TRINITY_DN22332_c0_g1_i1.p1  ORF type:complete len:138 (+),score=34.09 TRINITY_DN22332_c0_g1_i1:52-414(+)
MEKTNANTEKVENLSGVITGIDKQLKDNRKILLLQTDMISENKKSHQNELDTISKQISETTGSFENKSASIDGLSESVLSLEHRFSETIQRVEQVNILVSEYEVKQKRWGWFSKMTKGRK